MRSHQGQKIIGDQESVVYHMRGQCQRFALASSQLVIRQILPCLCDACSVCEVKLTCTDQTGSFSRLGPCPTTRDDFVIHCWGNLHLGPSDGQHRYGHATDRELATCHQRAGVEHKEGL